MYRSTVQPSTLVTRSGNERKSEWMQTAEIRSSEQSREEPSEVARVSDRDTFLWRLFGHVQFGEDPELGPRTHWESGLGANRDPSGGTGKYSCFANWKNLDGSSVTGCTYPRTRVLLYAGY